MYLNKKSDDNEQQNCLIFNFLYPENFEKPRFPYIPEKYKVQYQKSQYQKKKPKQDQDKTVSKIKQQ